MHEPTKIIRGKTTVIDISVAEIDRRRKLFEQSHSKKGWGRWPVLVQCDDLSYADIYGISVDEYCKDPIKHAEAQIAGQKWILENLETDYHEVSVDVIFGAVEMPSALGCEIYEQPNARPWYHAWVKDAKDLARLQKMEMLSSGFCAIHNEWRQKYLEIAQEYPVRFKDGEVFFPLKEATPAVFNKIDADPFSLAADLMGASEFFERLYTDPEFIQELIGILTEKTVAALQVSRKQVSNHDPVFVGCDYCPMVSPDFYAKFALPGLKKIKAVLNAPMRLHHCMIPKQILDLILTELKPEILNGFKADQNVAEEMAVVAEKAGGKVYLEPYLDGTRMMVQTADEIYADARAAIELFAPTGGFHLGAWASDSVSLESLKKLNAVKKASWDFAGFRTVLVSS